jgi:rhodanese-related sulfurtransferase
MKNPTGWIAAVLFAFTACAGVSGAGEPLRMMSVVELQQALADPALKIIDARDPRSWASSNEKIPGAVRGDPKAVPMWQSSFDPSDKIVVYCA